MDSFVDIVQSSPEEGGRAAAEVDSITVMPVMRVTLGSLCSRNVAEGDFMQVDTDLRTPLHRKWARTDRSEIHTTASSTLDYDKRVSDS